MTDHSDKQTKHIATEENTSQPNTNRRSFLTKAGIMAPVAMVSISKPAWGSATNQAFRCGISGMISGNVSAQPDQSSCRGGKSPGYWKNNGFSRWSSEHERLFSGTGGVFAYDSCASQSYNYAGIKLKDIMKNRSPFSGSLGFHAIAAYLNSKYISNYVFSTTEVLTMVDSVMGSGSFTIGTATYDCQGIQSLFDSTY